MCRHKEKYEISNVTVDESKALWRHSFSFRTRKDRVAKRGRHESIFHYIYGCSIASVYCPSSPSPPILRSPGRWITIVRSRKYFISRIKDLRSIDKRIEYESRLMSVTSRTTRGIHGPIIRGFFSQHRFYAVTRIRIRGLKEIGMRVSRGQTHRTTSARSKATKRNRTLRTKIPYNIRI